MSKFASSKPLAPTSPIKTTDATLTYEGGKAYNFDTESELLTLAAANMVNEHTFYQSGQTRDERFIQLVKEITTINPAFIAGDDDREGLASYLRRELKMRSASVMMACEYVAAGGEHGRRVITSVCQRPDEPAEVLGYWLSRYGRKIPKAVKRGVADAARRLFTQKQVIRWDGQRDAIRFADVIEMTHPKPYNDNQATLFRYLLDMRHHDGSELEGLALLRDDLVALQTPADERRALVRDFGLPDGWSWERLAGWLPGGMDAEAWETVIPQMGLMALLRNLRNFDQAGISEDAIDTVCQLLTDPIEVQRARIWPTHVWQAYIAAPSDNYKRALAKTFELSTSNVPRLPGRSLVLCDVSGSMSSKLSARSQLQALEVACVLGAAVAKENDADLVPFATQHKQLVFDKGTAALSMVTKLAEQARFLGGGTNIHQAIVANYRGHDRVIVFTDMQAHDSHHDLSRVPLIYNWDLMGYGCSNIQVGSNGRHALAGYSDSMFTLIPVLEQGRSGTWPF